MPDDSGPLPASAGAQIARGVTRCLSAAGFAAVEEMTLPTGLRVDVMALGPKGEIWVVECKSSRADFTADHKWQGYLDWCDRFFWAVGTDFPTDLLPDGHGLIIADAYDGQIIRLPVAAPIAPARRKALTIQVARIAANRLSGLRDPLGQISVWT